MMMIDFPPSEGTISKWDGLSGEIIASNGDWVGETVTFVLLSLNDSPQKIVVGKKVRFTTGTFFALGLSRGVGNVEVTD